MTKRVITIASIIVVIVVVVISIISNARAAVCSVGEEMQTAPVSVTAVGDTDVFVQQSSVFDVAVKKVEWVDSTVYTVTRMPGQVFVVEEPVCVVQGTVFEV